MSKRQNNLLVGVIIFILAMLVYPPFQYTGQNGLVTNMGYGWIFDPPMYFGRDNQQATINVPVLLVQWLGVILVGGLGFYLAKEPSESRKRNVTIESYANVYKNSNELSRLPINSELSADLPPAGSPVGVGGWLFLLIIGLMIINPLLGSKGMYSEIWQLEKTYPDLVSATEWSNYKSTVFGIFFGSAAIGFWGGLRLSVKKVWSSVDQAIAAMWFSGPGATVLVSVFVPLIIYGKDGFPDLSIFPGILGSIVITYVWTAYLLRSKRVRNTYQKNALDMFPMLDRLSFSNIPPAIVGTIITVLMLTALKLWT